MEAVTMYALTAGNHVEMGGGSFNYRTVPKLLAAGTLEQHFVDDAVARVLTTKFEMGLFENPFSSAPENQWNELIHSSDAVKLARKIDAESIVLLENNGVLPLNKKSLKSIAVIGPMADGFMKYVHSPLGAAASHGSY
jgi:beta-glucosidase